MPLLAVEATSTLNWTQIEHSDVLVTPERMRGPNDAPISRFTDDRWSLKRLDGTGKRLNWVPQTDRGRAYPGHLVPAFKRALYLMINHQMPHARRGIATREWTSGGSLVMAHATLRRFASWLGESGVQYLCEVTEGMLDDYARHLQQTLPSAESVEGYLDAVADLWRFSEWLPEQDRIPEPSWISVPLHSHRRSGENRKAVIHPDTFAGLIWWAQRVVACAPDIVAAVRCRYELESKVPSRAGSRQGRARAAAFLDENPTVPGVMKSSGPQIAASYLAAIHQRMHAADLGHANRQRGDGGQVIVDPSVAQPLPVPVTCLIEGRMWLGLDDLGRPYPLDWRDTVRLQQALTAACLITIACTTAMRGLEVVRVPRGSLREIPHPDGSCSHRVQALRFKGQVDQSGMNSVNGEPWTWATIRPGADAIHALEALAAELADAKDPSALANSFPFLGPPRPITVAIATDYIEMFIEFCSQLVDRLNLSEQHKIVRDVNGEVTIDRIRRTAIWHVANQPDGLMAAGVVAGHLRKIYTESYQGRSRQGMQSVLDNETADALARTLSRQYDAVVTHNGHVSGPSADRLRAAVAKHGSVTANVAVLTAADRKQLAKDPDRQVHANQAGHLLCVYDPDTALCQSEAAQRSLLPNITDCSPKCPNRAFTDETIQLDRDTVRLLQAQAQSAPAPIAALLNRRAAAYQSRIDQHEFSRTNTGGTND